ncbi:HlyD family secretion protein [Fretibacter rubidus]|uniref:HlyD family secretion protein n=1 Tax=Fretibacter rubidus TaxID=570162 RepID=UPI00352B4DE6
MSDLFRKEVIDKQGQRQFGDVFLSAPLSFWTITGLMASIIAGLIILITVGDYTRKERVVGVITSDKGLVSVVPMQGGRYDSVLVSIGDDVRAGQPLFQISSDAGLVDGTVPSAALMAKMNVEKDNILEHLAEIPSHYAVSSKRLKTRIEDMNAEIARMDAQIEVQKRAIEIEETILLKMQNLFESEAASGLEVSSQESRYLAAKQSLNNLINARERITADINDITAQIALLPHEQEDEENGLKSRLNALEQNMIRTSAQGKTVIYAPVAGKIASVTARAGQNVSLQNPSLTILPQGGTLQAEIFVPTRAAGFIKPGQTVRLLYEAFPYQKFGVYEGRITEISKTVIKTSDIPTAPQLGEAVFLASVHLDKQVITKNGEDYPLQSGMILSADIVLEKRKIWEWAFEPLIGAMQ